MPEEYFQLAARVISDGIPFHMDGKVGFRKGCIAVHMDKGRVMLVCDNLLPVELDSIAERAERAKRDGSAKQNLNSFKAALRELEAGWFGTAE